MAFSKFSEILICMLKYLEKTCTVLFCFFITPQHLNKFIEWVGADDYLPVLIDFVQMFMTKYMCGKAEQRIIMCIILGVTIFHLMLIADSRFCLDNNSEV